MRVSELLSNAQADPLQRLRWIVLRAFNELPCSEVAERMSDELCLEYAAQLVLDLRSGTYNPNFDGEKFESIREGRQ